MMGIAKILAIEYKPVSCITIYQWITNTKDHQYDFFAIRLGNILNRQSSDQYKEAF